MSRYYVYKLTSDAGGAPCPTDDVLTLAICKPKIRSTAQVGDWLFGFAGRSTIGDERLIYIAEITEKLEGGSYYGDSRYLNRPDAIYQWVGDELVWKTGSKFHPDGAGLLNDVGEPPYQRAAVLVSTNFRYMGRKGTEQWKEQFPSLAEAVHATSQGHRVDMLKENLIALRDAVWREYPNKMKIGTPFHAEAAVSCAEIEGELIECS